MWGFFFYTFLFTRLLFDHFLNKFRAEIEEHFVRQSFKILSEVKEMNITKYIQSNQKLNELNFMTVYQTITTLISSGVLSMDDFEKVKTVQSSNGFYKK